MNRLLHEENSRILASLWGIIALILSILVNGCVENKAQPAIILIEEGDYMYLAKVLEPYTEDGSRVHVHIFNDRIRKKVGDYISTSRVAAERVEPSEGWGTRRVAIQYFSDEDWVYTEDATEFEDHYLISITDTTEKRRVNFKTVRFPIPVRR